MTNKLTSEEFISRISKLHNLRTNNMYSEDEYNKEKSELFNLLLKNGISQKLEVFLADILEHNSKGILSRRDFQHLKTGLTFESEEITQTNNYNPKQGKKSSAIIIRVAIGAFLLFVIVLAIIILKPIDYIKTNNSYNESVINETKQKEERAALVKKYKYLEKRKLNSAKAGKDFLTEVIGLGFVPTDKRESYPNQYGITGYIDFIYEKTENACTIKLTLRIDDDGTNYITIE